MEIAYKYMLVPAQLTCNLSLILLETLLAAKSIMYLSVAGTLTS